MAPIHGRGTRILVAGYDVSGILNTAGAAIAGAVGEVTVFTSAAKEYIPGTTDGTLSMSGYLDADPDGASALRSLADRLLLLSGAAQGVLVYPAGTDTPGSPGRAAQGPFTTHEVEAPVEGAVTLSAEIQASGGLRPVVSLHTLAATTTTANGSAVDSGIAGGTANGGEAFLQVTAQAGTTPTLVAKVQGSADGATGWADLATFATVLGASVPQALRATWTGATPRYLRATWTITGTGPSFTFGLAAFRHPVAP